MRQKRQFSNQSYKSVPWPSEVLVLEKTPRCRRSTPTLVSGLHFDFVLCGSGLLFSFITCHFEGP